MILDQVGYIQTNLPGQSADVDSARRPGLKEIWRRPLPELPRGHGFLCRLVLSLLGHRILDLQGLSHVATAHDPFILALNHNQRGEALLIPALLAFSRQGRQVHFVSDWNFQLIPLVGTVIRLNDPMIVTRKPAKPAFLNRFKHRFETGTPVFAQARQRLASGRSVAFYPEGTINRHPHRLLRGFNGTARLSLETGRPVVPAGIHFSPRVANRPIRDLDPFSLRIGPRLQPPPDWIDDRAPGDAIRAWHCHIMQAISALSGKEWSPDSSRNKYVA